MNLLDVYKTLYKYIDELITNQKNTKISEQARLFSKKDYYNLLKIVLKTIQKNQNANIAELKNQLFIESGLEDAVYEIVYNRGLTPSLVIDFGTPYTRKILLSGNKEEIRLKNNQIIPFLDKVKYDTIYDLASTSKLFTTLAIYKLVDLNLIDLNKPITEYAKDFINLKNVTIYDLLKFKVDIITTVRIDSAKTQKEAENILFNSIINPHPNATKAYGDIGSMVLKYVIENISKTSLDEFLNAIIFKPSNMQNTYLNVPDEKIEQLASNNFNAIVNEHGNIIRRKNDFKGTSHDSKAKILKTNWGNAPGHAGYFSNAPDMIKLGNALLNNKIISQKSLFQISDNEVGGITYDDSGQKNIKNYYGSLVYLKQLNKSLSVYHPLSGKAFISPGFAGTTFCIDPLNKITMFIGANRLHNRIYQIPEKYIQTNEKLKHYQGKLISSSFTLDKEIIVTKAMNLAIQYQFLERLLPEEKSLTLIRNS